MGKLFLGQAPQALLLCFQMNGNENTGKIQNRRQDRLQRDLCVRDLHIVSHQECCRAQNGGHDLTAGRSGSFRSCRKLGRIAGLLHQRNGDRTGTHGIGNGRTGNHTLKCRCHNSHLSGTAGETTHDRIGDLNEEIADAGTLQERAEDNEHTNELGADINGGGEDAFLGEEQGSHQHIQSSAEVGIGQTPNQRIGHKTAGHDQNGKTHAAAADLCQGQNAHDTDNDLIPLKLAALLDNVISIEGEVQERAGTQHHQHDIIPGQGVDLLITLLNREHQVTHKHDAGHKRGQTDLFQPAGEQSHINYEQSEAGQQDIDNQAGGTFPNAGVGFPVILFHHGFQIHRLFYYGGLFLKKCHIYLL